jgi:hypothetical protein
VIEVALLDPVDRTRHRPKQQLIMKEKFNLFIPISQYLNQ